MSIKNVDAFINELQRNDGSINTNKQLSNFDEEFLDVEIEALTKSIKNNNRRFSLPNNFNISPLLR